MIVLMTGVLQVNAPAHDNHRLLSYYDNVAFAMLYDYHTIDTIAK